LFAPNIDQPFLSVVLRLPNAAASAEVAPRLTKYSLNVPIGLLPSLPPAEAHFCLYISKLELPEEDPPPDGEESLELVLVRGG